MATQTAYDIIVAGGGPAGALAAKHAVQNGNSVAILERKEQIGVPVRCGEAIGLKGLTASVDLEDHWILSTISSVKLVAPNGNAVSVERIEPSYVIDRTILDKELVDRAVAEGCCLHTSTCIHRVEQSSDGTYICRTNRGEFTARCLILADGVESRLARDLGWSSSVALEDMESCAICHVAHDRIRGDTVEFYVGTNYAPGGFVWVFPRAQGLANIGLGIVGSQSRPGKARDLLDSFVTKHFPDARVSEEHCAGVPVGQWIRPLVRGGAMIVGDAAQQVNSLSGAGIAYAMCAGRMAGDAAASAFANGSFVALKLKFYEKQWASTYGKQQVRSYRLKSVLMKRNSDRFINDLASSLNKEDSKRLSYMRVFLRTFARHPLMLPKVFMLFR